MPITIKDSGSGNSFSIEDPEATSCNGTIVASGNNARVVIKRGVLSTGFYMEVASNGTVAIGPNTVLSDAFIYCAPDCHVVIGNNVSLNARVRLLLHEPSRISIGAFCLVASDVDLMTSDMHSVFDRKTGERINPAKSIEIQDWVWIGQRTMVLKGASVGSGAMIAAGSIVVGTLPENVIAAGNPARIIRTNIRWDRELSQG